MNLETGNRLAAGIEFVNFKCITREKAELEKASKKHRQNFDPEKLAHKICAKKLKIVQKEAKLPKVLHKMQTTFKKRVQKLKDSTAVKN